LIDFKNVSVRFRGASSLSLKNLNLHIGKGEMVLIRGPSGGGKSTLCLCLNGIIPHLTSVELSGDVLVNGFNTRDHEVCILSRVSGLVFQNPDNQLFASTVEEDVAFGPENLGLLKNEICSRVDDALSVTRLLSCRSRPVYHLSGGQKQRTAIAGIHAMNTDIMVLDEPTADLDPRGTREVLATIRDLNRKKGKTIILVEHKIGEVWNYCPPDRIITIDEGELTDDCMAGDADDEPYLYLSHPVFPKPAKESGFISQAILKIRNLSYTYPDGTSALSSISMDIAKGEFISVVGENGCGKSTLLMHISGLITPPSGTVFIDGEQITKKNVCNISKKIGYLFQNPDNQICMDTVFREISVGLHKSDYSMEIRERLINQALITVDLAGYENRDPNTLSRGERQRLAVASLLAKDPHMLLLDEPTTGQDYDRLCALMTQISSLNGKGTTILMVTHDLHLATSFSDRILFMKQGKIAYEFSRPYPSIEDLYSHFFEISSDLPFSDSYPPLIAL